jgi:hypothetical protein
MARLELLITSENTIRLHKKIHIMIFTEGTILGSQNIFQHFNHASYIPIKNSINVINSCEEQGAEIIYFISRKKLKEVQKYEKYL